MNDGLQIHGSIREPFAVQDISSNARPVTGIVDWAFILEFYTYCCIFIIGASESKIRVFFPLFNGVRNQLLLLGCALIWTGPETIVEYL